MPDSLQVLVNGEPHRLSAAGTLRALLEQLELDGRRIAVALNGEIVPRSQHETVALRDGDELLIVQAIGGG